MIPPEAVKRHRINNRNPERKSRPDDAADGHRRRFDGVRGRRSDRSVRLHGMCAARFSYLPCVGSLRWALLACSLTKLCRVDRYLCCTARFNSVVLRVMFAVWAGRPGKGIRCTQCDHTDISSAVFWAGRVLLTHLSGKHDSCPGV